MRRVFLSLLVAIVSVGVSSCGKDEFVLKDDTVINTNSEITGRKIILKFSRGEDWFHDQKIFTFNVTITPQIAVWAEKANGEYLQTLFVTNCFAKQDWKFAKNKDDECIQTMCMPYWFNKYLGAGNKKPTKANPIPDAMSGATPTGNFVLETNLKADSGKVNFFVELNKSFDHFGEFNEERESAKFNGQPSIIYKAEVDLSSDVKSATFKPVGYGGETGDDPELYTDLEKVERAKTMVKEITADIL